MGIDKVLILCIIVHTSKSSAPLESVLRLFWEHQHIANKMKRTEAGLIALRVLQYKVRRNGFELIPEKFRQKMERYAILVGSSREEVTKFFEDHVLPEVNRGCGIGKNVTLPQPSNRDCLWALAIVSKEYLASTKGLKDEIGRICDIMGLKFHEVASLAHHIITENLKREFGEKFVAEKIED